MNHAYIFPFPVAIDPAEKNRAIPVDLDTDHDVLTQAAANSRLCCPFGGCLEPVTLVHREAGKKELRCFAHLPEGSHPCPFRSETGTYIDTDHGPRPRREHNLRKQIENALHIELQRHLAGRRKGIQIESSAYKAAEPCIRITGLGPPLQIRGLAPGCEALWRQPFAGSIQDEEVLFFVVSSDAPALEQPFIDSDLLARRPALLVTPAKGELSRHTYSIVSRLAEESASLRLDTVDLIRIDFKHLFGLDRPAEYLFLPIDVRREIEAIGERLAAPGLAPEEGKMLRLLAKHLLVGGSPVHSTVFGQKSRQDALRFLLPAPTFPRDEQLLNTAELGRLVQDRKLQGFCTDKPLLAPLWGEFLGAAFAAMGATNAALRKQANEAGTKLVDQQAVWSQREAELEKKLKAAAGSQTELKQRLDDSEEQIRDQERTWKAREAEFQQRLDASEAQWKEAKVDWDWVDGHRFGHQMLEHYHRTRRQAPSH